MWYSCLSKRLPESVNVDGKKYEIRYGYRTMIAVEIAMYSDMSDEDKIEQALSLFYQDNIPEDTDKAIEKLLWFHGCGTEGSETKKQAGSTSACQHRAYDFTQDAGMIYAAFKQQYGINLHTIESNALHWWEFSALFEGLTDMTKMGKVIYWRTCDTKNMSKTERKHIEKMRNIFAIKDIDGVAEKMSAIESAKRNAERLAKRNAEIIGYVGRRYEECRIT